MLLTALLLSAAAPPIGIATAEGVFRLAGTAVVGTATVREGAIIETETQPARLRLYSGASIELSDHSRVKVFPDRMVLEGGRSMVHGSMRIFSREGVLVARTSANNPVHLSTSSGASSEAELTGILAVKDDVLSIRDEMTRLDFPLDASGQTAEKLKQAVGKKVTIKGTLQGGRVVVASMSIAAGVAGVAVAATTAATAAKAGAVAVGASKAIVAGVTVAATAGATGATVGFVRAVQSSGETISQ